MARKLVLLPVLAVAVCAALWLVWEPTPGGGVDTGGASRPDPSGDPAAAPAGAGSAQGTVGGGTAAVAAEREDAFASAGRTGLLIAQVIEVDQCIDAAGTEVILKSGGREYRATVAADGVAPFEDVRFEAGETLFSIETSVPDRVCYPESFVIPAEEVTGSPPSAGVSIALVHIHVLAGRVFDATSRAPVEGALVRADSFAISESLCDEDGAYRLNLPEPRGTLIITAPGYQELLWHFPEETPVGFWLPDQRDFELLPDRLTAWLTVRAVSSAGIPATGAEIEATITRIDPVPAEALTGMGADEQSSFLASLDDEVAGFGPVVGARDVFLERLDEEGEARLRLLVPGRYRVDVRSAAELGVGFVEVGSRERMRLELRLARPAALRVRVMGAEGPLAGVHVVVDSASWRRWRIRSTDARGEANFSWLAPGEAVLVWILSDDWFLSAREVLLPEEGGEVLVALDPVRLARAPLCGSVVDARTGRPLAGAQVEWCGPGGQGSPGFTTERDGRFVLEAGPDGVLHVSRPGCRDRTVERIGTAPEVAPIALEPLDEGSSSITVRVLDAAGDPVEGAAVNLAVRVAAVDDSEVGRLFPLLMTAAGGSTTPLRLNLLGAERAEVGVEVRHDAGAGRRTGYAFVVVGAGSAVVQDVILRESLQVRGRAIMDFSLAPAAHAEVMWAQSTSTGEGATLRLEWQSGEWTAADGSFELAPVHPGRLWLRILMPFRGAHAEIEVPPAGVTDLRVVLEPTTEVIVTVADATDGRTLSRFPIAVPMAGGYPFQITAEGHAAATVWLGAGKATTRIELERRR